MKKVFTGHSNHQSVSKAPRILTRSEHGISRKDISDHALKVLYRLHNGGYKAYLVGGCVRDLLLGLTPKDFDVVTDAEPEQVKALFRNCRIIGRRFRLVHVMFGREVIEVATFRGHHQADEDLGKQSDHGQILRDNVFGSIQEDAERRDFTINAMYYDIADFSISDFADGIGSIERRTLSLIGDPETRYREDPVRMLRAVRFAAKLDMQIDSASANPIKTLSGLLSNIPPARLFEEVLKLFLSGQAVRTLELMQQYQLLQPLFPILSGYVQDPDCREMVFIRQVMHNTDERINSQQRVTPAFIYAAMLWFPVEERCQQLMDEGGLSRFDDFNMAMGDVLDRQTQRIMIPKRFSTMIREIWQLQQRLPRRFGRRAYQLLEQPRFSAAFVFILLRGEVESTEVAELGQWWQTFQHSNPEQRKKMLDALRSQEPAARRRRKYRAKKKPQ